ncbi:MAG: S1 family peptidase [Propionibacteriaceae bacterium]|nr:S1 family peptidase [Propionibacteriaceae bacterium]
MNETRPLVAAFVVGLVCAIPWSQAQADDDTRGASVLEGDANMPNEVQGDASMVAAYAEAIGLTNDAAQLRMSTEGAIVQSLALFGIADDSSVIDVWLETDVNAVVLYARSVDPASVQAVKDIARSTGIELRLIEQDAFVQRRSAVAGKYTDELSLTIPGLQGFFIDPATGDLVLDVVDGQLSATDVRRQSPMESTAARITNLPAHINSLAGTFHDTATVNGGVALSNCTAAFPGSYNLAGRDYRGFFTAAHCGTQLSYFYGVAASGAGRSAAYRAMTYNANADIAFHSVTGGDIGGSRFYGSSASVTTGMGPGASAAPGATVCKRGRDSGYSCGKVESTMYRPTYPDACKGLACNASFVKVLVGGTSGDSGGPVWTGVNLPVGIIKGGDDSGSATIYSKIGFIPGNTSLG